VRATQSESTTPISEQDAYDLPRGGLGSGRARFEIQEDDSEMGARRVGISKFSSLMSSSFLAATSSLPTSPEITENEDVATAQLDMAEEEQTTEEKRKKKKKKGDKDEKKEKKMKDKVTRTEVKDPDTLQTASLDDVDRKARKAQRKAEKRARKAAENNLH
jgi:Pin2-interacting protein X1